MNIVTLRTNYNNKLDCLCFCHIDAAPGKPITETDLSTAVFEIRTVDNSHPPVKARLINLLRVPLKGLTDHLTLPSHGMNANEYYDWILSHKPNYDCDSQMAVYFYKREPSE